MGVNYPPELIKEIKRANPLAQLMIEDYGKEFMQEKTVCDFHKDTSPSLHVYSYPNESEKDNYHCYVCDAGTKGIELHLPDGETITDAGSDVIAYVQNKEKCSWYEAVKYLAARANIPLPEERKDPVAEKMKAQVTAANRQFYNALKSDPEALQYLYDRGIEDSDIASWRLGMVPWDWAEKRYAGRIVFGMTEVTYQPEKSATVAMAYRAREHEDYIKHGMLDADETDTKVIKGLMGAKYYNDPTSKVYEKKHFLYGLNESWKHIKKHKHAVLMEGYMDVIMAHKNGLKTAVASCGTSITEDQILLLKKYTNKVYLWLDGDEAGLQGMIRALPMMLKHGLSVFIVESPAGKDPADLVKEGHTLIKYIMQHAKPAVQIVIDRVVSQYDRVMNQARIDALENLLPLMENIARPADKANYLAVVENKLGVRL